MRKKLLMLMVICCIGLVGCGNKEVETIKEESTKTNETEVISTVEEETEIIIEEESSESIKPRENTTFRNSCWGDDIETVKKYEDAESPEQDEDGNLLYEGEILTYKSYIIYFFEDNKLVNGMYGLNEEYTSGGQYISQYEALKNGLKEIYGEPIEDVIIPMEKQSLIDIAGSSTALENGYVVYRSTWETETSKIVCGMQAQNFEIGTIIQYTDKNYKEDLSNSGL